MISRMCWRCGHVGRLVGDPLLGEKRLTTLCDGCATQRKIIAGIYAAPGFTPFEIVGDRVCAPEQYQ